MLLRGGLTAGLIGPPLFAALLTALTIVQYDFLRGLGWHPLYAWRWDRTGG
jgi:hypothetical protein